MTVIACCAGRQKPWAGYRCPGQPLPTDRAAGPVVRWLPGTEATRSGEATNSGEATRSGGASDKGSRNPGEHMVNDSK